jgi:hypothetical protein
MRRNRLRWERICPEPAHGARRMLDRTGIEVGGGGPEWRKVKEVEKSAGEESGGASLSMRQ